MKTKWPKEFSALTAEQELIREDFLRHWHEILAQKKLFNQIENFNHSYPIRQSQNSFVSTLEIGAGIGEHLAYETLTDEQADHYIALELRENMAERIRQRFPKVQVCIADCQQQLPYETNCFDRILAIHVLEHLCNLPMAIKEMYRVCNKQAGRLLIVIPCEGGFMYQAARKISAQRIFEKKYRQPYQWFIEREHVNKPEEIIQELSYYFEIENKQFFPFHFASIHLNLCIGLTLIPKKTISE